MSQPSMRYDNQPTIALDKSLGSPSPFAIWSHCRAINSGRMSADNSATSYQSYFSDNVSFQAIFAGFDLAAEGGPFVFTRRLID